MSDQSGQRTPPDNPSRRSFLTSVGYALAGAALSGCTRRPAEKAIPYLIPPEGIAPGVATWYATSCPGCSAGCGVLAKCCDGRPIKFEGLPEHPVSAGGLCAVGQASLLGLYDSHRLAQPRLDGADCTWQELDGRVAASLSRMRQRGGGIRLLTSTITSPTEQAVIDQFVALHGAQHVVYDALSCSAIAEAHQQTHGVRAIPGYRFDRAALIVSVEADFLGTWLSPVQFTRQYVKARSLTGRPPRCAQHVQLESRLSPTGAKADVRLRLGPAQVADSLLWLCAEIARRSGRTAPVAPADPPHAHLSEVADRLWHNRKRALVVCGRNELGLQLATNLLNDLLGGYGRTLSWPDRSYQRQGDDRALQTLLKEAAQGQVEALLIHGGNPLAELPGADVLAKVPFVVAAATHLDETARSAAAVAALSHPLETWVDSEAVNGTVSLGQPLLQPFGQTRSFSECLAAWCADPRPAEALVKAQWQAAIHPRQKRVASFEAFWAQAVRDGFASVESRPLHGYPSAAPVADRIQPPQPAGGLCLELFSSVAMLDGRLAENPWLQEVPDPITKATWDNHALLSPATAATYGVRDGDVVKLEADGAAVSLPVLVQPGQADGLVAAALGYGRAGTARFAEFGPQWIDARPSVNEQGVVGANVAVFLEFRGGCLSSHRHGVTLTPTGESRPVALTQTYDRLDVPAHLAPEAGGHRPMVQAATLAAYAANPHAGAEGEEALVQLWQPDHPYAGHHWAMAVDLHKCTGCAGCVVACNLENNVPVVGRDEVLRRRELHWMRIDRYYEGSDDDLSVAHQPLMCHHCDNAPCEVVCPVLATVHSAEGLNQQVYNRCVGTRYCANNCPYKVRRFNWFDYPQLPERERLALNPDVTTRSRGVMEKCSFCIQRIEAARIQARAEGRDIQDGDVQPACAQSCPAGAIVFGDLNDPTSRVSSLAKDPRFYQLLTELNVQPSVGYLRIVRDRPARTEEPDA